MPQDPTDPFDPIQCPREPGSAPLVPVEIEQPKCDPPAPVPFEIFTPLPKSPQEGVRNVPAPVWTIRSPELTYRCSDFPQELGPVGQPVTIPEGRFSRIVRTDQIPNLTASQHARLKALPATAVAEVLLRDTSTDRTRELTGLTRQQAAALHTLVGQQHQALLERTSQQARQELRCGHINTVVTVWCPDQAIKSTDPITVPPDLQVLNPATEPAGRHQHPTSQASAQEAALASARSRLACLYGNDPVEVSCLSEGFPTAIPNDEEPLPLLGEARVGSVRVEANQFFSRTGKQEANQEARAFAIQSLNCFYTNDELTLSCAQADDLDGSGPAGRWDGTAVLNPTEPADASANERGNPVRVPSGFFKSTVSQEQADQQARQLALQALDCHFRSAPQTVTCPPYQVGSVTVPPSPTSPVMTVTVPEGAETSTTSQQQADQRALQFATLQLQCLYCNVEIPPVCVPPEVFNRPNYTLPLPLEWFGPDWSADATRGVPAGAYCAEDPTQPIQAARQDGTTPARRQQPGCRYGNEPVRVGCVRDLSNQVEGPFGEPDRQHLSRRSYPDPMAEAVAERSILIPADTVSVWVSDQADVPDHILPGQELNVRAREWANQQARAIGTGYLDCFFESPPIRLLCYDSANESSPGLPPLTATLPDGTLQYGDGTAKGRLSGVNEGPVMPDTTGSTASPVLLPAGTGTSVTSRQDAIHKALLVGIGMLDCAWTNPSLKILCGARADMAQLGVSQYPPFSLQAGNLIITDKTKIETRVPVGSTKTRDGRLAAIRMAIVLGLDQLNCVGEDIKPFLNPIQADIKNLYIQIANLNGPGGTGGVPDGPPVPGPPGPSSPCSGQCHGFYS